MKRIFTYIVLPVLLAGIFLIAHNPEVQALEITAELSSQSLQLDSYGQLQVTVTGARKAEINVPDVDGLTIQNRGSMQSMQIINGDTTISYTANFIVIPQRQGKFTIDPITATVKGETVTAAPINFDVTGAGPSGNGSKTLTTEDGSTENELAFLRFIPQKDRLFVGEKVPFQLKAYFKRDASELTLPVLNGDGFIVAPFSKNPQQKTEYFNGQNYNVLTWDNYLSGVKSGSFPLQFTLNGTLLLPRKQQARDPFGGMDPFFNDFFSNSRYQQVPVEMKSEPAEVTVIPLPLDKQPADFSGAVGQFSLSASASPVNVSAGEPVTLRLVVTGDGNFDRVQCPEFPDTTNFKVYQADESGSSNNQQGKIFERAVVPKSSSADTIPAHSLTYFDPELEQYVTTTSKPIPLTVTVSADTDVTPPAPVLKSEKSANPYPQQQPAGGKTTKPMIIDNLAPQKLDAGSFSKAIVPVHKQFWFVSVLLGFVLCLACLLIIAFRRKAAQHNPERQIEKQTRLKKQMHLKAINDACQANDPTAIMETCRAALQFQAGLLSSISPSAVTAASLAQQHNINPSLVSLLKIAEEYCYGGILNQYSSVTEYAAAVRKELEGMA